jgi:hypothetical protein
MGIKIKIKRCNKCGRNLPVTRFNKNNQQIDGLYKTCKCCLSKIRKIWDHNYNQTAKARATAKRYYYSEKGQKNKKAYRKNYKLTEEQRERYRIANRRHEKEPKYKARRKRYDQSNKGKEMKAQKDKRYAHTDKGRFTKQKIEIRRKYQIKITNCTLTLKEWQEIKKQYKNCCAYCNKFSQRLEKDHVIPLAKGGAHVKDNIVPACRTCNAKKGAKLLNDYLANLSKYSLSDQGVRIAALKAS